MRMESLLAQSEDEELEPAQMQMNEDPWQELLLLLLPVSGGQSQGRGVVRGVASFSSSRWLFIQCTRISFYSSAHDPKISDP